MQEQRRQLLYLDFRADARDLPELELEASGWELRRGSSVDGVQRLLPQARFRVALVRIAPGFESGAAESIGRLAQSLRFTQWVALVGRDALAQDGSAVARVIAQCCFDYHTLPIDRVRLLVSLGRAYGMSQTLERVAQDSGATGRELQMVGASKPMQQLFRDIRKVAAVDAPVFIDGESGTGKELTARAIHERSRRGAGPFVAVDCAALPPTLIQSELFGYEKGAFTGAAQRKAGRIESASGGTLFLDEIGDLPADLQGNLLRFLQESTIQRIGAAEPTSVDVRVIAATHVDLNAAQSGGRFRQDLFFRLNVLRLNVPPLRERGDDIELLARYFFDQFARDHAKNIKGFTHQALQAILRHAWPGNIRELINRIRRAVVMCESRLVGPADLGLESASEGEQAPLRRLDAVRALAEREAVHRALLACGSNLSEAARALGISRVTLYHLLDKYSLATARRDPPARRRGPA